MEFLAIDDLRPNMVISRSIIDGRGITLLPKGTRLTTRHIVLLKTWGISGAYVEGHGALESHDFVPLTNAQMERIEKRILERFPYRDLDPVNKEIRRVARRLVIQSFHASERRGAP